MYLIASNNNCRISFRNINHLNGWIQHVFPMNQWLRCFQLLIQMSSVTQSTQDCTLVQNICLNLTFTFTSLQLLSQQSFISLNDGCFILLSFHTVRFQQVFQETLVYIIFIILNSSCRDCLLYHKRTHSTVNQDCKLVLINMI